MCSDRPVSVNTPDINTVAVTGGTGFIGHYTLHALLKRGIAVRALVRPSTNRPDNLAEAAATGQLIWIEGSLGDPAALEALTQGAQAVIHLAGVVKAKTRDIYMRVNASATGRLASIAARSGVSRFVLVSSMAARRPELSDYAASKLGGEAALSEKGIGMIHAIIRAPAVFGAGDKATEPFIKAALKGVLPVPGGRGWRERKISLVHAQDLSDALVDAALIGLYDFKTVSPATEPNLTWPEFAAVCAQASGRPVKPLPLPLPILRSVAAVTTVTSRLFGAGHLTLGKLREFLYQDWSSQTRIDTAPPLVDRLRETLDAVASSKTR